MPGFDFSNYNRNAALHARGVPLPKATSTGTTIVGCIFDGGVVVCTAQFRTSWAFSAWFPNRVVPTMRWAHLSSYSSAMLNLAVNLETNVPTK